MAKKKKNWSSLLKDLPELIDKAVDYFDDRIEKGGKAKESYSSDPRNIDQAYLSNFEKSLPRIANSFQDSEKLIHRKAYSNDLQTVSSEYGYKERVTFLADATLFRMSMRNSIVSAIIITRTNQLSNFARQEKDQYTMGFEVVKKKKDKPMTEEDLEKREKLENFIMNCGLSEDRAWDERMNFEEFLRRIIQDRLVYDSIAIELIPCEDGTLHHFLPVSSSTIRYAGNRLRMYPDMMVSTELFGEEVHERPEDLETDPQDYKFVQLYQGLIVNGFTEDELIYRHGNPTNEPSANGYSIPELERLVSIVTSHIFAETHNKQFFTGGFTANGILHFEGDIPQEQMDGFRRAWETQVTGANNSFRTPIVATEEKINWLPINISNKDMEWQEWMNYLIKIICAVYQIDPSEIGFWNLSQGGGSTLNEGNRNESILRQSKDKGLRPLLRFVESIINDEIFPKLGEGVCDEFEFRFVGLDAEERIEETERHAVEVKSKKTVNQVRQESGLQPLPHMDNLILDPIYFQWWKDFSPESIELKVRNKFLEKTLNKRFSEQMKEVFPEDSIEDDNNEDLNDGGDKPQDDQDDIFERSNRNLKSSKLLKVEYIKA